MQHMLITVRYRVAGNHAHFRHDMSKAAAMIAELPGLAWKIWGFDQDRGAGVSAYLFESEPAARAFLAGPVLERLRNRPDVTEVTFDIAPVDRGLSAITGATRALAAVPTGAAITPAGAPA
ncbi:YdhR family protein [Dongia deserti]|uniref:YdhR family protein n=1 Tax=Dongia deserti TaxID=2268030 RepID=UPI0013C3FC44|nr:YdhR family protein [Dongia deserti]